MSNLEIARCEVTIRTETPTHHYGWIYRGVSAYYSLPFGQVAEQDRFVHLLAEQPGVLAAADEAEHLAALLCLYRSDNEAASACAADHLEREGARLSLGELIVEMDDVIDRLLEESRRGEP